MPRMGVVSEFFLQNSETYLLAGIPGRDRKLAENGGNEVWSKLIWSTPWPAQMIFGRRRSRVARTTTSSAPKQLETHLATEDLWRL